MKINHLDLFSGIGGFHLGFEKAGFEVNSYFSEIDKYAIDVYKNNFKNSKYVGSVTDVRAEQLPRIDAITFGSPCQDFSLAGKRKGMGGDRSSLITEAIRLIDECRPRFFIWENVKGTFSSNNGEDFWAIIQAFTNIGGYRLEWQLLNTKWFLPQNRERIYLVGYLGDGSGGQVFPISKVVESFIEKGRGNKFIDVYNKKYRNESPTLTDPCHNNIRLQVGDYRYDEGFRWRKDNNSPALHLKSNEILVKSATAKGYEEATEGDSINYSNPNSKTRRGRVGKGVAQTLDTTCNQAVIGDLTINQQNKINKLNVDPTISGTLTEAIGRGGSSNEYLSMLKKNKINTGHIRRLTPIECERLQGFPDNWTEYGESGKISDTQRYKMCGNAVTVDVVEAVAKNIIKVIK